MEQTLHSEIRTPYCDGAAMSSGHGNMHERDDVDEVETMVAQFGCKEVRGAAETVWPRVDPFVRHSQEIARLEECMAETNRDWARCQTQVKALKACNDLRASTRTDQEEWPTTTAWRPPARQERR